MRITIEKNLLLASLTKLVNITERRSIMPILSNILISFMKQNIDVFSTDLELSAISRVEYSGDLEKKIVVHGRKFLEILREMESEAIELDIQDNTMILRQKQTEFVLSLQDPEEFPEIKEIEAKEEFVIKGKQLIEMIEKVGFAVSVDETRYILTGMFMKGIAGEIIVVGTDGFRMALYQKKMTDIKGFQGITIPKRSVSEIEKVIDDEDEVKISIDEKHVQLSTNKIKIVSRIIEGSFPDYENVLPAENTNVATVQREGLLKGLKKVASVIGRSEPVRVSFENKSMIIEAESDIGRARETIDIEYIGEKVNMNFNVRFLLDVVAHTPGEILTISAPKTYGAVLFKGEDGEEYKNIVMPIRI